MDLSARDANYFDYCLMRNELKKIFISHKQILRSLFISLAACIWTNLSKRQRIEYRKNNEMRLKNAQKRSTKSSRDSCFLNEGSVRLV